MPKISYVIASRNDNWCGDSMGRLRIVLNRIRAVSTDYEIIVADWGSEVPLHKIFHSPEFSGVRFVYIPPEVTGRFDTPFDEVHALNCAIRRSHGSFIGRIDQDTLIGRKFVNWINGLPDHKNHAWFSTRRELRKGIDYIEMQAPIDPTTVHNMTLPDETWYNGAVGILLASRRAWEATRGYDERLIYRNAMEHDLCWRFGRYCGISDLGKELDYDFYHLWHERPDSSRKTNPPVPARDMGWSLQWQYCINSDLWGLQEYSDRIIEVTACQ